jgi:glycosyltransferase involved in cell wall biosynthesis
MSISILSICIPTYNRGEILHNTLEKYINDPAFDERVEIVISDNCSTDQTEELVKNYLIRYKNIKYNRLPENIGADLNMNSVVSMGSGLYLKLMNDSVTMRPGVLKYMLDILSSEKNEMKPVFFYQNISFLHSDKIVYCSSIDDLVSNVSFWITWIANFGVWRKDFDLLTDKDRLAHLQFTQTDWTIRLINRNRDSKLFFGNYYITAELDSKGGYNVFKTFGINYLSLYDEYLKSNSLRKKTFNTEKYRLFRYFIVAWYQTLIISKDKKYVFEKKDVNKILMENFKYKPYFYFGILYLKIRFILQKLKSYLLHS